MHLVGKRLHQRTVNLIQIIRQIKDSPAGHAYIGRVTAMSFDADHPDVLADIGASIPAGLAASAGE